MIRKFRPGSRFLRSVIDAVASGRSGRGVSWLCGEEHWRGALELISAARKAALITGFFVPAANAPETDGPPGTVSLARALSRAGIETRVWSDALCLAPIRACARALGFPEDCVLDASGFAAEGSTTHEDFSPDLLIYVERLGRASDGAYYNMRGEDISRWTPPLDRFAAERRVPSIGIGDGGNEVGMGIFKAELERSMPDYAKCLCAVETDVCIPVDVSNWGAYALAAVLSRGAGEWLGQSDEEEMAMFDAMCDCGTVDGVTKLCTPCADGFDLDVQVGILRDLRRATLAKDD